MDVRCAINNMSRTLNECKRKKKTVVRRNGNVFNHITHTYTSTIHTQNKAIVQNAHELKNSCTSKQRYHNVARKAK